MRPLLAGLSLSVVLAATACGDAEPADEPAADTVPGVDPGPTTSGGPGTTATTTPTTPTTGASNPTLPPPTTADPRNSVFDRSATRDELNEARERWASTGFRSYTFRYAPTCFCPATDVEVAVIEGNVVQTIVLPDTAADTSPGVSIEEWFDRIDDAIDTAYRVDADYHDDWGFPTAVFVDVDDMTADEEWGMVFDGFADRTEVLQHLVNQSYDCGYGFWASTPDQGVSIQLAFAGPPDAGVSDVAELDDARVLIGSDLMANWCDDVMEPGEPVAEIAETWAVTGGTIEIAFESDAVAVATLTGIVATTPDGQEIVLGDGTYRNEAWGVFAG